MTYLDYAGSALYPESLVRADAARLAQAVLGNPHSESGPSRAATGDVESARRAILAFLSGIHWSWWSCRGPNEDATWPRHARSGCSRGAEIPGADTRSLGG